ncbi:hypothetical protein [Petropleomorpha daqingensis]|uniref:Uncharacterized protein n=1 Tax=Petropleomorpha daqingensis TaxID=2026353 RepID=A0A853CEW7_9ACTN|nr:hypothetical protein [Petropleomorpha daqingensis]NYJ06414.1 hypothetical protein [Petropleomorpha daqingensis]
MLRALTDDVDSVVGSAACRSPADDTGFELERTEIVSWGLCPVCNAALNDERLTPRATSRPVPPASQEEGST